MTSQRHISKIVLSSLLIFTAWLQAATNIEVMALFKDKAMVMIDNEQHLLKVGESGKLGVKLIEATSKYAVLEVNGKQSQYILGNRVQARYAQQENKKLLVYRNSYGMFKTTGSINGYTVDFLVDTGASAIALNSNLARRLGLQYKLTGDATFVNTASGTEPAYSVHLDRVKVGEIMLRNVAAVVIEGNNPSIPLLGMSYLGRLNIINEGQVMKLEQKF